MTGAERIEQELSAIDEEIRVFRHQKNVALGVDDIMKRYGVCKGKAYSIIRGIKSVCGGGLLPGSKVLPCEVHKWESIPKEGFVGSDLSPDWGNPCHVRCENEG